MICRNDISSSSLLVVTIFVFLVIPATVSTTLHDECPGTDVATIRNRSTRYELSLIYYYASWNQESRIAKSVYDEVAQYHQDDVYFAAVDCWHFACNCSHTHEIAGSVGTGAPHTWPTLMARYDRRTYIQYHDEWTNTALMRFLQHLLRPLVRVYSKQELKTLNARSDAVVLGLFAHPDILEYRKFVVAAVKWLDTDPERNFRFAIALGTTAVEILSGVDQFMPQILMISRQGIELFNDTATSSGRINNKWHTGQIISWTKSGFRRSISHASGYSTPATLATRIRKGPVLAIFTNDISFPEHLYTVMEKVVKPNNSARVHYTSCTAYWRNAYAIKINKFQLEQHSKKLEQRGQKCCEKKYSISAQTLQHYYYLNKKLNLLFDNFKKLATHEKPSGDHLEHYHSAERLLEVYQLNKCLEYRHFYHTPEVRISIARFLKKRFDQLQTDSFSLRNRTLSIVILDAIKYGDYLNALSISHSTYSAATVFIVESKLESIFVMQEPFTYDTLQQFVQSFYTNSLVSNRQASSFFPRLPSSLNMVYLQEYNRQMFLRIVDQHNVTTVVLLYAPTCSLSAILSHTLTQLSVILQVNDIKFIRLDVQANNLPWEFVMPTTPTLIVFPRARYSESRIFPMHLKANIRNVFGFILAQLEPVDQVRTVWSSCKRSLSPQRLHKCLQFAKALVTQHIAHHLKCWRVFENERHLMLDRLKEFNDLSLNMQSSFEV